jgi:ADP-heptose:LPS heptosyltransferase
MSKNVLILALGNIASTIYTLPLARVLKDYGLSVDYVVSEKGYSVIYKNPAVKSIFLASMEQWTGKWLNSETWEAFFKVVERIQQKEYDIVIDCQQDLRSLLIFAMCKGKRKLTYSDAKGFSTIGGNEFIDSEKPQYRNPNGNIVERNLNFLKYLKMDYNDVVFPLPEPNYTFTLRNDKIFELLDKQKKTVVISAGARNENKRWTVDNWKELISRIDNKFNLIFTGSTMDKPFVKEIGGESHLNLCGETRVEGFVDILRRADIVISSETETTALAWATKNPSIITLFTCTSPEKYSPFDYENKEKYISLYGNLDCQPCQSQTCWDNIAECRKYPTVDDVIRALTTLSND